MFETEFLDECELLSTDIDSELTVTFYSMYNGSGGRPVLTPLVAKDRIITRFQPVSVHLRNCNFPSIVSVTNHFETQNAQLN